MTPDAIGPLLAMAAATSIHDAHELAVDAVKAGATGEEVRQAITEWMQIQVRQVQTVVSAPIPPYTHKPVTTAGGLRVVGWSSPAPVVDDGPDHIAPSDRCTECGGWGGWTETVVGADGSDVDVDYNCSSCGATGVEP